MQAMKAPEGQRLKWVEASRVWARRIKRDGVTLWFAIRHPDTPWLAKALAALVVAYALSPIDFIPDFIPVLGYLDDVILLPLLIALTVWLLPDHVRDTSRTRAEDWMVQYGRKPATRWGGVFVVAVWLGVIAVAGAWLWPRVSAWLE